jgi:hypothetical protein
MLARVAIAMERVRLGIVEPILKAALVQDRVIQDFRVGEGMRVERADLDHDARDRQDPLDERDLASMRVDLGT